MTLYIAREASKLWRRVVMETAVELPLLADKWKLLLAGLIFQAQTHAVRFEGGTLTILKEMQR